MPTEPASRHTSDVLTWDELIPRYLAGDNEAGDRLFRELEPMVRTAVRRVSAVRADADYVVQNVLARLAEPRLLGHYDPKRGAFRPWVARIVRNAVVDQARARARRPALLFSELPRPSRPWDEYEDELLDSLG